MIESGEAVFDIVQRREEEFPEFSGSQHLDRGRDAELGDLG
jgi:hypothetical protein